MENIKNNESLHLQRHVGERAKQSRFKVLLISWGFSIILILPSVDQWLGISTGFVSTEKRVLTPFPSFNYPHVKLFIDQFKQYYKDNLGWRNALFYQYSHWKYYILHTSPLPEKAVVGKNGWFYPGNSMNQVLNRHRGVPICQDTLAVVAKRLTTYQQQLATQGTKLYLLIAPDSYTIYPENLPDHLQTRDSQANFNQIKTYLLNHTAIPLIDVREPLMAAKLHHVVYFQTDTHWNYYGSLLATIALVNRVRQDFPAIPQPRLSDYQVEPLKGVSGDLVIMLALNNKLSDSVQYKIEQPNHLISQRIETPKMRKNAKYQDERYVGSSVNLPKLMFHGDSFSYYMSPFLTGYFCESYLVRTHQLDMKLARAEHPDVVIIEIVERNVDLIGWQ